MTKNQGLKTSRAVLGVFLAGSALANAQGTQPVIDSGNTAWILTATALILFMTMPGLALSNTSDRWRTPDPTLLPDPMDDCEPR